MDINSLLPLITSIVPPEKMNEIKNDASPHILEMIFDKLTTGEKLQEGEANEGLFITKHEGKYVAMNVFIDRDMNTTRKIAFVDLLEEIKNYDVTKLFESLG